MQVELASLGHDIGLYRTASFMRKADEEQQYAPNILKR
jgi:hypothetical protein